MLFTLLAERCWTPSQGSSIKSSTTISPVRRSNGTRPSASGSAYVRSTPSRAATRLSKTTCARSKYQVSEEDSNHTLLDLLASGLAKESRTRLRVQHRMVKPIGDLISEGFYDGDLQSVREARDPHLRTILPKPVTWISTSAIDTRREERGASFSNSSEVREIVRTLERPRRQADRPGRRVRVWRGSRDGGRADLRSSLVRTAKRTALQNSSTVRWTTR